MHKKSKYITLDTHKYGVHSIVFNLVDCNKSILDIGCATGYLAKVLKEKNCEIWGIDKDDKVLEVAKKFCKKVYKIDVNNLNHLKIKKKFDYILVLDVIEHLTYPEICLKELKKILKIGGKIIISTPNIAHLSIRLKLLFGKFEYQKWGILDDTHIRFFTKKTFISHLRLVNLEIDKFDYSVDFGQIPLVGRVLDRIPSNIQRFFTNWFNTLLAVQFIAVCKNSPHYFYKE